MIYTVLGKCPSLKGTKCYFYYSWAIDDGGRLSDDCIVGITIGCIVFVPVIIILIVWYSVCRKNQTCHKRLIFSPKGLLLLRESLIKFL
jgi:hypothetical protein